jgi:hypothetical protein
MEGTCTQNSLPRTLAKACFKFSSLAFIVATVFAGFHHEGEEGNLFTFEYYKFISILR